VCTNVPEYTKILHPFVQENNRTKTSVEDQASDAVISIGSNPTPLIVDIGKASICNAERRKTKRGMGVWRQKSWPSSLILVHKYRTIFTVEEDEEERVFYGMNSAIPVVPQGWRGQTWWWTPTPC
jgi:hypothetical protein